MTFASASPNPLRHRASGPTAAWALALLLTACGGGGSTNPSGDGSSPPSLLKTQGSKAEGLAPSDKPPSRDDAARFLTQATFGPTQADIDHLMDVGYSAWIDEQFAKPITGSHQANYEAADAIAKAADPKSKAGDDGVVDSFWKMAVTSDDALRQRMTFALSEIFVVSMLDGNVGNQERAVANWLDMLRKGAFGNYRDLLQSVAMHPIMGTYLTHLHNQKADPKTGRVPDENFAREIMQLFSIGVFHLKDDGTLRLKDNAPDPTYTSTDINGLAKVFTGWSWACPGAPTDSSCFQFGHVKGDLNKVDPDRWIKPMVAYPAYHATEAKTFLGTTIPAQNIPDPAASLKAALDTISQHHNVGPFIGRQLIQRFVTSNPSKEYVAAVAAAFNGTAGGVRGDLKATLKAVLLHPEARAMSATAGKVREPVLRLSAYLRAFPFKSSTGFYKVNLTDDASTNLGQTPLRAPSVFNFYRPGYVAPGTKSAAAGLVTPEFQIVNESSIAGYVNVMRDNISRGVGDLDRSKLRDLQPDFTAQLELCTVPAKLVEDMNTRLLYGQMPPALKNEMMAALKKIVIPDLKPDGSNKNKVEAAKRTRVNAAVLLTVSSPEFLVQK